MSRTLKEAIKEELLTCGICVDLFQDPKILPCLHTYCDECLRTLFAHEVNTYGRHELKCPTCRACLRGASYDELDIKDNFNIMNLLETIQSSPNNESFVELYRIKEGLNLDLAQAVAIAEKSQSGYLLTQNHELEHSITDLRQKLAEERVEHQQMIEEAAERHMKLEEDLKTFESMAQLTSDTNTIADLGNQIAEKDQTIADLIKTNDALKHQCSRLQFQSTSDTNTVADLWNQIAEKDQTIADLMKTNDELKDQCSRLQETKDSLECAIGRYKRIPLLGWLLGYKTDATLEGRTERGHVQQATGWWMPWRFVGWFIGKRQDAKN